MSLFASYNIYASLVEDFGLSSLHAPSRQALRPTTSDLTLCSLHFNDFIMATLIYTLPDPSSRFPTTALGKSLVRMPSQETTMEVESVDSIKQVLLIDTTTNNCIDERNMSNAPNAPLSRLQHFSTLPYIDIQRSYRRLLSVAGFIDTVRARDQLSSKARSISV